MQRKNRRPRVLIITKGDMFRLIKIVKLSKTLSEAGYEVIRLGFKTSPDDPEVITDSSGTVIRIDDPTAPSLSSGLPPSTHASTRRDGPRELLKRMLFRFKVGQRLRAWVIARRVRRAPTGFLEKVNRWNSDLAKRGLELEPDMVISSQLPVLEAGHSISQALNIPLVYDVRDLFVVAGYGSWSDPSIIEYERGMIGDAALVMTVAPRMAEFLENHYSVARPLVLYNCNVARAEVAGRPSRPVRLLFQGFFSPIIRLDEVVRAMALLEGQAILTLQGQGAAEEQLRKLVDELGLQEVVRFEAFVPPLEAPLAANAHDIGISHRRAENENLRRTIPNKLFDYLGGGLAVLSSDVPSMRDIIEEYDCGALFEPSGPQAIAEAVALMCADTDRLWEMKRNALAAWDDFSWDKQAQKLLKSLDQIVPVGNRVD